MESQTTTPKSNNKKEKMNHVRLKFNEAKNNNYALAEEALPLILQKYFIEQKTGEQQMSFEQRKILKQLKASSILKK